MWGGSKGVCKRGYHGGTMVIDLWFIHNWVSRFSVDGALVGVASSHKPDNRQSFLCLTWLLRFPNSQHYGCSVHGLGFALPRFKTRVYIKFKQNHKNSWNRITWLGDLNTRWILYTKCRLWSTYRFPAITHRLAPIGNQNTTNSYTYPKSLCFGQSQ